VRSVCGPSTLTPAPDLKIISSRSSKVRIWHYEPAIQLVVDLGVLEEFRTNKLPGFDDRLVKRLPGLMNHCFSRGRRRGFVEPLATTGSHGLINCGRRNPVGPPQPQPTRP
jgi:cyanophycin synthetase